MTTRKFSTFSLYDATPTDHLGRRGEITYRDGYLYYHDGVTPGGELIGGGGGSGGPTTWTSVTGKPSIPTDINDLTDTDGLLANTGDFTFTGGTASLPADSTMILDTFQVGGNKQSTLTLSTATISSLDAGNNLRLRTGYGTGFEKDWILGADGSLRFPDASVQTTAYTGSDHAAYEITNTSPEGSIYSVSVGTDGVVTMTTARGGIEFGAMPEVGGPTHFHIMRPAGDNGTDLYFGDDYNYVLQRPSAYGGAPAYGVEIGANDNNGGAQQVWRFGTDGKLTTPAGLEIYDEGGFNGISSNGGLQIDNTGLDQLRIIWNLGENELPDFSGADVRAVGINAGVTGLTIEIIDATDDSRSWNFRSNGILELPQGGDIVDNLGNSVLGGGFSGVYADLTSKPTLFDGDYNSLTNKPTYRIAVATGSGPGGNLQADSLALAGLNPVTDIPSTWGGDLILQGGVGGANGDLYGEVRIKSGQIGANYEWHFTTDKKIKLPAGGDIVNSTGTSVMGGSGSYAPANAGDWAGTAPTTIAEALDRIAARLNGGGTGAP